MEKPRLERMGSDCIEIIKKKLSREMSRDEYYLALMDLHQKYPIPGHNPPLTRFQLKNYREIQMIVKDRDTGVKYRDHLYPFNFQEAAEMFIRSRGEIKERLPFKDDTEEDFSDAPHQDYPSIPSPDLESDPGHESLAKK